jgi:hypothetical protein
MASNNSVNKLSWDLQITENSADNYVLFSINGVEKFKVGRDLALATFNISSDGTISSNDPFIIEANSPKGAVNLPLQPCFLATVATQINNVTGNASVYQVQWDTTVFDQNSDWDGTDTFQAPVSGRYLFCVSVSFGSVSGGTTGYVDIATSNRSYKGRSLGFNASQDVNNQASLFFSVVADMDAIDTMTVNVMIDGIGADTADIITGGAANPYSWISGCLVA